MGFGWVLTVELLLVFGDELRVEEGLYGALHSEEYYDY
jgi:hypothetical protein